MHFIERTIIARIPLEVGLKARTGRRFASAIAAVLAMSVPASADSTLPLDGTWGNEAGCKFAREGASEDDTYVVLKADELQSYGTGCEWVQVFPGKNGAQAALGICGYEGEAGLGAEIFVIAPDASDTSKLTISKGPGDPWGVVQKCP